MVSDNSKQLNFTLDSRASRFSRGPIDLFDQHARKAFFLADRACRRCGWHSKPQINIQIYSNALGHYTKLIPINI
jgi:hypothetical protein